MTTIDNKRPSRLYFFGERTQLERSLQQGEFRLAPPSAAQAGDASFLILSLTTTPDGALFEGKRAGDAWLVIHQSEVFGERLHKTVQRTLPNWAGIDAAISYGAQSMLGKMFSKDKSHAAEKEWRFAWRPMHAHAAAHPVTITLGSIADIAELRLPAD